MQYLNGHDCEILSFWLSHLLAISLAFSEQMFHEKMEALADLRRKFCRLKELMLVGAWQGVSPK